MTGDIRYGLPSVARLQQFRIWDSYFTPAFGHPGRDGRSRLLADIERSLPAAGSAGFEKMCFFPHVGTGTTSDAAYERLVHSDPGIVLQVMERWPDLLLGMIQLNANDVHASSDAIKRWIQDGPMLGVYFPGGGPGALTCTHPVFGRLVEQLQKLDAVIMQHTWFKTGGKQGPGESTPAELATLAARHPQQTFICAHAGGEWQQGIRAVQAYPNILVETSGFDATAGFIEMAVRELGPERIVFGSHLPSRSLGTELGKVIGAEISDHDRALILGENYRRLLKPILQTHNE